MPHRQQLAVDLAVMEQRIRDGEGYLQRMRELLHRARERGEDTVEVERTIGEMEITQLTFVQKRDELARMLDDAGPLV